MPDFLTPSPDDAPAGDTALTPSAEQAGAELRDAAAQALHEVRDQWKAAGDEAMEYIRKNPGKAALAGLGVGFFLGLLFRR